jgi:hypothetical protein
MGCIWLTGCGTEPPIQRSEAWSADLRSTSQVLIMGIRIESGEVTGAGTLAHLTNIDTHDLAVTGALVGDSLHLTYNRPNAPSFRFRGRYAAQGLLGYLLDAEFDSVAVAFRRL